MKLWVLVLLSIGHMVTDIHQGILPIMLPYLKDSFDLSYFAVGAIMLVANLSSSVVQPLFGLFSDKVNIPWLLPLGMGGAALGLSLAGVMPSFPLVLLAVFLSGLGVAAYHPEGSKMAHFAAGSKRGSAMSIFSVGGNFGFGIGPVLGAFVLGGWGLTGSLVFLAPGLIIAVILLVILPKMMVATGESRSNWQEQCKVHRANGTGQAGWSGGIFLLIVFVVIRSWIQFGLLTFIPFYYVDYLGGNADYTGAVLSVFLIAGAVGTVLGGPLADLVGNKKLICGSMSLAIPFLYLYLNSSGTFNIIVLALTGMVLISTAAPSIVMGQQYLPHNIGLASGLMIGFAIGMGGLGASVMGLIADNFGLLLVMKIVAFLPVIGFGLASFLPVPPTAAGQKGKVEPEPPVRLGEKA